MYDVIVVGAGPGGSVAAKKCAELGMKTLILDKRTLPRDKLCSGMIMGVMARGIIEAEFGAIPENVLTKPANLLGIMVHASGIEPQIVERRMPFGWRRDLDLWMAHQAKQSGAELRDRARVISVEQRADKCVVRLDGEALEAKFVVGADGARSTVRRFIFPEFPVVYRTTYRECYQGEIALDRNYFHWIFPIPRPRPRFDVNHKGECLLIEGGIKELRNEIAQFLRPLGFSPGQKLLWKDGCISGVRLAPGASAGSFTPARGNVLFTGDAAMLQLPVSGEGIGMALKSGLLAAQSIAESKSSKRDVADIYRRKLEPVFAVLKELTQEDKKLEEAGKSGPKAIAKAFAEGLRATLRIA